MPNDRRNPRGMHHSVVWFFLILVALHIPVAFALGIATIPVVLLDLRLTPFIVLDRMFQSYNSFILLAVQFFLLAASLMNSDKVTDRLIELARVLTGWMLDGRGHVNVAVISQFAIGAASAFGFILTFFKVPSLIVDVMTTAAIGGVNVAQVMRDVVIILCPMLIILLLIIIYPQISLWLPKTLMRGARVSIG
jgi:TRAP-type C4-dicarboxylate transport system permease large subunit